MVWRGGRLEGAEGWRANSRQIFVVANTRVRVGAAGGRGFRISPRRPRGLCTLGATATNRARPRNKICGSNACVRDGRRGLTHTQCRGSSLSHTHTQTRHTHTRSNIRCDNINTCVCVCVCVWTNMCRVHVSPKSSFARGRLVDWRNSRFTIAISYPLLPWCHLWRGVIITPTDYTDTEPHSYKLYIHSDCRTPHCPIRTFIT